MGSGFESIRQAYKEAHLGEKNGKGGQDENFLEGLGHATLYSLYQAPANAVAQLTDKTTKAVARVFDKDAKGTNILAHVQYVKPLHEASDTSTWLGQQIGGAVGMLPWFAALHKGIGAGVSKAESVAISRGFIAAELKGAENALAGAALKRMAGKEILTSGLTGAAHGFFFTPTDSKGNFWREKFNTAITSGVTFSTLTASTIGLQGMARRYEGAAMARILKGESVAGLLSAVPAGFMNAQTNAMLHGKFHASWQEYKESTVGFAAVGGLLPAFQRAFGNKRVEYEHSTSFDLEGRGKNKAISDSDLAARLRGKIADKAAIVDTIRDAKLPSGDNAAQPSGKGALAGAQSENVARVWYKDEAGRDMFYMAVPDAGDPVINKNAADAMFRKRFGFDPPAERNAQLTGGAHEGEQPVQAKEQADGGAKENAKSESPAGDKVEQVDTTRGAFDAAAQAEHNKFIAAAMAETPPDYLQKTLETRTAEKRAGSYWAGKTPAELKQSLLSANWEPYDHPNIQPPATAYKAEIPGGRLGLVAVESLPPDTRLQLIDPKGTGKWSLSAVTAVAEPETSHVTMIVGPDEASGKPIVWTMHPGEPTRPSMLDNGKLEASGLKLPADLPASGDGRRFDISRAEAERLGFNFAKIENPAPPVEAPPAKPTPAVEQVSSSPTEQSKAVNDAASGEATAKTAPESLGDQIKRLRSETLANAMRQMEAFPEFWVEDRDPIARREPAARVAQETIEILNGKDFKDNPRAYNDAAKTLRARARTHGIDPALAVEYEACADILNSLGKSLGIREWNAKGRPGGAADRVALLRQEARENFLGHLDSDTTFRATAAKLWKDANPPLEQRATMAVAGEVEAGLRAPEFNGSAEAFERLAKSLDAKAKQTDNPLRVPEYERYAQELRQAAQRLVEREFDAAGKRGRAERQSGEADRARTQKPSEQVKQLRKEQLDNLLGSAEGRSGMWTDDWDPIDHYTASCEVSGELEDALRNPKFDGSPKAYEELARRFRENQFEHRENHYLSSEYDWAAGELERAAHNLGLEELQAEGGGVKPEVSEPVRYRQPRAVPDLDVSERTRERDNLDPSRVRADLLEQLRGSASRYEAVYEPDLVEAFREAERMALEHEDFSSPEKLRELAEMMRSRARRYDYEGELDSKVGLDEAAGFVEEAAEQLAVAEKHMQELGALQRVIVREHLGLPADATDDAISRVMDQRFNIQTEEALRPFARMGVMRKIVSESLGLPEGSTVSEIDAALSKKLDAMPASDRQDMHRKFMSAWKNPLQ
jgi:hypothetical protein